MNLSFVQKLANVKKVAKTLANGERFRREIFVKAALALFALVVLAAQFSQAVTQRFADGHSATVLPARIRAARVYSVTAGIGGSVLSVAASPGDRVQAGQELAVIDSFELRSALERANVRLNRTQQRMESGPTKNPMARIYSEQLSAAQFASKQACELASDADAVPQERTYEHYHSRLKSVQQLAASNLASLAEVERSRREEQDALHALKSAREHRLRLQQECNATLAQARVTKLQLEMQRDTEFNSAQAEYDSAAAEIKALSEQQQRTRVVASRAGTVLSAFVSPGDRVQAGTALLQIGDVSELSVEVAVEAEIAQAVNKGDAVTVRLPTHPPREIEAKISSVVLSPGEDSRSYVVRVVIANPDPRTILAGLEGAVAFHHSRLKAAWNKLPF